MPPSFLSLAFKCFCTIDILGFPSYFPIKSKKEDNEYLYKYILYNGVSKRVMLSVLLIYPCIFYFKIIFVVHLILVEYSRYCLGCCLSVDCNLYLINLLLLHYYRSKISDELLSTHELVFC